jgi:hypothetical protein
MNNQIHGKAISKANEIHGIYINFNICQFVKICSKLKVHTNIYNFIHDNWFCPKSPADVIHPTHQESDLCSPHIFTNAMKSLSKIFVVDHTTNAILYARPICQCES